MKKLLLAISMAVCVWTTASAWSPRYDGTMMPLDLSAFDSAVPWDTAEMTPVHIEYVARHGARFLSSPAKVSKLRAFLEKAREKNELTEKGASMLALTARIDSLSAGKWGSLSPVGVEEEIVLARKLWEEAPALLRAGHVSAKSSPVERVVMTMYEFCHELNRIDPQMEIITEEGPELNPLLRFFETDKAYVSYLEDGPWKKEYEGYATATLPEGPAADMVATETSPRVLREMSMEAYGILQALPAMGITDVNPSEWFNGVDWIACWKVSNLQHYYQRSANQFSTLPEEAALPLWQRMQADMEAAFQGKPVSDACLWFGHAETIIPLFSLLDLPGCRSATCLAGQVADKWVDSYVSPLGANLAIVCLVDRKGGRWVATRLNGTWLQWPEGKVIPYSSISTSKSSPKRSSLSVALESAPKSSASASAATETSSLSDITVS